MRLKKLVLPLIFLSELGGVGYYFVFSAYGLQAIHTQREKNVTLEDEIDTLQRDVSILEGVTHAWEHDPFHMERVAREELHMARDNEIIYFS